MKTNTVNIYPKVLKDFSNYRLKEKLYKSYFSKFSNLKSWILSFSDIIILYILDT